MIHDPLEKTLRHHRRDIVMAMTFGKKEMRGHFDHRPVELIYELCEQEYQAHCEHLLFNRFQPLVAFADALARRGVQEGFRLHELLRSATCYKRSVTPVLIQEFWDDRNALVTSLIQVDRSVDRFIVNLSQAFLLHAKETLASETVEFPVWVERERRVLLDEVATP
jgi:hypothetical protein